MTSSSIADSILIKNVRIFDGNTNELSSVNNVLIEDNLISVIVPGVYAKGAERVPR
jgi:hypothetical protein